MASKHDLLRHLKRLSDADRKLWTAFRTAEDNSYVHPLNFRKLLAMRSRLAGTKRQFVREHPTLMVLSVLAALATPLALPNFPALFALGMLVYGLSLIAATLTRDAFIAEYSRIRLQSDQLVDHAFGIDKVSLLMFNSFDQRELLDGVSQADIGKLIKLVKAGYDYTSTTYGYYDHLRKAFIAGLFALPVSLWIVFREHSTNLPAYWSKISAFVRSDRFLAPAPVILTLLATIVASILVYSLAFGDQRVERRKRRYLLWLNLLHESWQK